MQNADRMIGVFHLFPTVVSVTHSPARGRPAGLWVTDELITHVNKRLAMPSSFALVFSQPGIT